MEKTLTIDGKPTRFKCTGGFLLRYRELTGKDPIKEISSMESLLSKGGDLDVTDTPDGALETLYSIIWVMAKTANPDLPDMVDWVDSFDEFPLVDIFTALIQLVQNAFQSNLTMKGAKKKQVVRK